MNLKPKKQQLLGLLPNALVQTHGPRHGNVRFLSFDDGPDPEYTPRLLDLLAKFGVHASFFVVGRKAELYPAVVERIVADGRHRILVQVIQCHREQAVEQRAGGMGGQRRFRDGAIAVGRVQYEAVADDAHAGLALLPFDAVGGGRHGACQRHRQGGGQHHHCSTAVL